MTKTEQNDGRLAEQGRVSTKSMAEKGENP